MPELLCVPAAAPAAAPTACYSSAEPSASGDIQTDCNCDEECGPQYPDGFQCSIAPGEDEYTQIGDGNACPGGYTECDGDMCDLHPACRQNEVCGDAHTYPPDLPCVVPKRAITQGEGRGEVIVVHSSMTFDDAEQDCVARGGHLASVHSSEDFQEIHEAAERAFVMVSACSKWPSLSRLA
jgi:hypothetical protein